MSSLVEHAKRELETAGLFDKDADYGGNIGSAVMELVEKFARQGHSGGSAASVIAIFNKVASYENLTPLTDNPDEWYFHEANVAGNENGFWQNKRNSAAFSVDGGKTYYLVSEGGNDKNREPLHTSAPYNKENN